MELPASSQTIKQVEDERSNKDSENINITTKNRKKKKRSLYMPQFGCFASESDQNGSFEVEADCNGERQSPTHLIIMVNGLIGSAQNWRYAAKQFLKKYPEYVIAHCSECNPSMLTFDGVDVMGERLAEEVISVIIRHPNVQKISFIGHSLGGLVARYAIGRLYGQDPANKLSQGNGDCTSVKSGDPCPEEKLQGKIAGLEPMNFITSATPHLGSRGHKQVPMFCGFYTLEKVASRSSWFLGRTGRHLFLTDTDKGTPLLLRMVNDCEDLQFMSALKSFRRRVAYANATSDHLVGWGTSSLRRLNELPKQRLSKFDKYPHIVFVEPAKTDSLQLEVPLESKPDECNTIDMEEEMLRALRKVSWERVDVSFSGIKQKFLAHSTIQVKNYSINGEGADVVQHMIDNFLL